MRLAWETGDGCDLKLGSNDPTIQRHTYSPRISKTVFEARGAGTLRSIRGGDPGAGDQAFATSKADRSPAAREFPRNSKTFVFRGEGGYGRLGIPFGAAGC
jgi:hypothetical protein